MKAIILTNNTLVLEKYKAKYTVDYIDEDLLSVLYRTRDKIHKGHKLLSHPLSGSVKPNETVFKSIIISEDKDTLDFNSLMIVESSIETANKLISMKKPLNWPEKVLEDFKEIDCALITSGIESMRQFG